MLRSEVKFVDLEPLDMILTSATATDLTQTIAGIESLTIVQVVSRTSLLKFLSTVDLAEVAAAIAARQVQLPLPHSSQTCVQPLSVASL